jgi:hypothetical protein
LRLVWSAAENQSDNMRLLGDDLTGHLVYLNEERLKPFGSFFTNEI